MLIDYGYLDSFNGSTLQAIMKNRKIKFERLVENLGKADITYLVNFNLLKEYFLKKFKSKKNCFTKVFFRKMGIIERAKILERKMTLKQRRYMALTLFRLLKKDLMGEKFKVMFAFRGKKDNFLGFK